MKHLLLAGLLGMVNCTGKQPGEQPAITTIPTAGTARMHRTIASVQVDTVDHFFFTDAYYQRLAAHNQLDMLKLDSLGTLDVVGRDVEKLRYKVGETTTDFLTHNLPATDSLPFERVRLVAWSSDLSGNDEKLFYFKGGRLRQVRKNP